MRSRLVSVLGSAGLVAGFLLGLPGAIAAADPVAAAPAVADAQSADDAATAHAIATAYGHPVTIDAATSETILETAEPDGSTSMQQTTEPVRVERAGSWVPTDLTLHVSDGVVQPLATAVAVQFSAGGSGMLAQIKADSGQWLTENWKLGSLPAPTLEGNSATYAEVLPDVDLRLTATATGMAEVLVIKNAEAAINPNLAAVEFSINDGSLTTTVQPGGTAVTKAPDGSTQLVATAASWWDSSTPGTTAGGPGGLGVPLPASATVTDTNITVDAAAATTKPDVAYPIYVDPPFSGSTLGWGYVDATFPDTSYWEDPSTNDHSQHVGYIDAADTPPNDQRDHTTRSFWQMDTSGINATYIKQATFTVTNVYSYSCTARQVNMYVTTPISTTMTWNHQPTPSTLSDSKTFAYGYSSACPATTNNVDFDATAAVQRSANASYDSINFSLRAASETDASGWKKFAGQAVLSVSFYPYPKVPAYRDVSPCFAACGLNAVTSDATPVLKAMSDTADHAQLKYTYQVCGGHGSTPGECTPTFDDPATYKGDSNANDLGTNQSHVAVPAAYAQRDGWREYQVQACRTDLTTICSDFSGWFPFTVDTQFYPSGTTPTPPTVSPPSDIHLNQSNTGAPTSTHREFTAATFGFTVPGISDVYGYGFSDQAGTEVIPNANCTPPAGSSIHFVCADSNGAASGTFVPIAATGNTVTVYAFDAAGNLSNQFTDTYSTVALLAAQARHAWLVPAGAPANTQPIVDRLDNVNGPTLDWTGNTAAWQPFGNSDNLSQRHDATLAFTGTSTAVTTGTTGPVTLDATHDMTIAMWVKPTTANAQTIAAQKTPYSAFQLGVSATHHWQFCLAQATAAASSNDCAVDANASVAPGNWTLLIGEWISGLHQVEVYDYAYQSDGSDANPVVESSPSSPASHTSVPAASTSPLQLGCAVANNANTNCFTGTLTDPMVYAGVLDKPQRGALYRFTPTEQLPESSS